MKQKILIGSIFAVLILLSMPFVSTLQAAPAPLNESNIVVVRSEDNNLGSKDFDDGLGFIDVGVIQKTPTGFIGCPGIRVILRNNNQVVRTGRTNIAGMKNFFGLPNSNSYTVVFSITRGSTKPLSVRWNRGNTFRWENLDFSEDTSIESYVNIETMYIQQYAEGTKK